LAKTLADFESTKITLTWWIIIYKQKWRTLPSRRNSKWREKCAPHCYYRSL